MNELNGLLATSEMGPNPQARARGDRPELWEAPQWPFPARACPAAPTAPPFVSSALRFLCACSSGNVFPKGVLLKPTRQLRHL